MRFRPNRRGSCSAHTIWMRSRERMDCGQMRSLHICICSARIIASAVRVGGHIARREGEAWLPADGFDETLTIFDLLCDAKPGRRAAGDWKTTLDFGGQVHRGLMEPNRADELELLYDRQPERLRRVCLRLDGTPIARSRSCAFPCRFSRIFASLFNSGTATTNSCPACAFCGTRMRISICAMRRCTMPSA